MLGATKKTVKKQMGWRIESDLAEYIEKEGKVAGQVNVIEDCIRLHRTLHEVLSGYTPQLEAYATANALTMRDHESAVLARLIVEGIKATAKR